MLINFLVIVALASSGSSLRQDQKFDYNKQAELDAAGNIHVSSDEGKLIKMAGAGHCIEVRSALDKQTVGCSVARGTEPGEAMQSLRLEIYLKNGYKRIIESKTPLMEWHFWHDGQQVNQLELCPALGLLRPHDSSLARRATARRVTSYRFCRMGPNLSR